MRVRLALRLTLRVTVIGLIVVGVLNLVREAPGLAALCFATAVLGSVTLRRTRW